MGWQIGDRIENRYEIHDIKGGEGKSGFGIVYICYDLEFKNPVAVKTFQAKFLSSQKAQDEFREEALTWTRLDKHKNIVRAYYVKNIEGQPYIFMEYVVGGNLDDLLYIKQLDLQSALNFALQFCTGMDDAYQKIGLIHRDIKPSNILLTRDKTIKITDFGLAKTLEVKTEEIVPPDLSYVQSTTAGTLPYMAPEQFTGQKIDTRADIYSFGIVLYQMVAMSYPYPKRSSWLEMHLKGSPLPIRHIIPAELTVLIHKCLQKNPAKRYQNFSELRHDLSKIYVDLIGETIAEESAGELGAGELVNKGYALNALDKPDEAVACYDQALEINPRYAEAWVNKGNALSALGKPEQALACCEKVLRINPRYAEAWVNKGNALGDLGRADEAIACYDQALEINPRYADAWVNKGNALRALGRSDEAIACYDQALEINPRLIGAWYNKGVALRALGRPDEAVACYDQALEIKPLYAEAWINKGGALHALDRPDEAIACYNQALEIKPRCAEAWYNKGNALRALGRSDEALACYDEALEIKPQYAEAWINKGSELNALGKPDEALACCKQALEIKPRCAEAWNNKGNALGDLGRPDEAVACYDEALEINPRDAEAWNNKGVGLRALGRPDEAISAFQQFIEYAPPQYASHVKKVEKVIRQLKGRV